VQALQVASESLERSEEEEKEGGEENEDEEVDGGTRRGMRK
jgi:hypothetical protein